MKLTKEEYNKRLAERAEELMKKEDVKKEVLEISETKGKERAEMFLCCLAAETLLGEIAKAEGTVDAQPTEKKIEADRETALAVLKDIQAAGHGADTVDELVDALENGKGKKVKSHEKTA